MYASDVTAVTELTQAEFDQLPDYSLSNPTGIYNGRRWKRRKAYNDPSQGWLIGRYDTVTNGRVTIHWSHAKIKEN